MKKIYEQALKITEDEYIFNTQNSMVNRNGIVLREAEPAPNPGANGSGGNGNGGDNGTPPANPPAPGDKNNQNNQNQPEEPISAMAKSYFSKNDKRTGLIILSKTNQQRIFEQRIVAMVIYMEGEKIVKSVCQDSSYKNVCTIQNLGKPIPQLCKDPEVQKFAKEQKQEVFIVTLAQVEILKKNYKPYKGEEVNLKMLQKIQKDMLDKEDVIYEHLDRLYNDMIATQGSGRLGAFNAG